MQQMPAPEPANLPGGYYGPPVVLPTSTPPPPRRRTSSCCLLSTAIRIFVAVCAATVVALVVLWLVFRPHRVRVAANAALTRSNLTSPYDLAAAFSIRNPNRRIGVHYDWLEARAYLGDQLRRAALPRFYQGHKNTTVLGPLLFAGVSTVGDGRDGRFDVELWLRGRVRYKFGSLATTRRYDLRAKCNLNLPLIIITNSSDAASQTTTCHVYRN